MTQEYGHHSGNMFARAEGLSEPLRSHFPKSPAECRDWEPLVLHRALSSRVLAVAVTRIECSWAAYCDAVPGMNHHEEVGAVRERGSKLDEPVARAIFPRFAEVPYAY